MRDGVVLGVEAGAGGGDGAVQVEAVFEGDGDAVERGASVGVGVEGGELLGAFEGLFCERGDVGVARDARGGLFCGDGGSGLGGGQGVA